MKLQQACACLALLAITMLSCRKHFHSSAVHHHPESGLPPEEYKPVIAFNKELGEILEKVYADEAACREVNAAIYSGYYEDERVLLKDLLNPSASGLYGGAAMRMLTMDTGIFRRKFYRVVEESDYPLLRAWLKKPFRGKPLPVASRVADGAKLVRDAPSAALPVPVIYENEPAIYFPYSENFADSAAGGSLPLEPGTIRADSRPTIVVTDRDANEATGEQPYSCTEGENGLCYRQVQVDDLYAMAQPTHIITSGAVVRVPLPESVISTTVTRVFIGWAKLTRQMDKLISLTGNGGGSEIKIGRINNYLGVSEQQVTRFAGDLVTIYFTRADIRKERWKRIYSIWDPNWSYQDIEQIYAVYEDDTQGKKTFSGSLSGTANLPGKPSAGKVEGETGFKIEVSSQDEILLQRKLDRKSYLKDGLNNQGWGYLSDEEDLLGIGKDWPIYDGHAVWQYTLPYRIN